jgi:hypothetical protein
MPIEFGQPPETLARVDAPPSGMEAHRRQRREEYQQRLVARVRVMLAHLSPGQRVWVLEHALREEQFEIRVPTLAEE